MERRVVEQESELSLLRVRVERLTTELGEIMRIKTDEPGLLTNRPLTPVEQLIDERIRTLCLVVCAIAVVYFALWTLSDVLALLTSGHLEKLQPRGMFRESAPPVAGRAVPNYPSRRADSHASPHTRRSSSFSRWRSSTC